MAQQLEQLADSHEELWGEVERMREEHREFFDRHVEKTSELQDRLRTLEYGSGDGGDSVSGDELREFSKALRDHQAERGDQLEQAIQKTRGEVEDLEKQVRNLERRVGNVSANINELEDELDKRRREHEKLIENQDALQRRVGEVQQTSTETKRRVGELQRTRTERALGWLKGLASGLRSRLPIVG
jgi:DNA repair exonuclease SbcCD ATPase subunit